MRWDERARSISHPTYLQPACCIFWTVERAHSWIFADVSCQGRTDNSKHLCHQRLYHCCVVAEVSCFKLVLTVFEVYPLGSFKRVLEFLTRGFGVGVWIWCLQTSMSFASCVWSISSDVKHLQTSCLYPFKHGKGSSSSVAKASHKRAYLGHIATCLSWQIENDTWLENVLPHCLFIYTKTYYYIKAD